MLAKWLSSHVRPHTPFSLSSASANVSNSAILPFSCVLRTAVVWFARGVKGDGALRREGPRTAATAEARADMPGPLPPGAYRIEYRSLSADGHVGGGAVRFRLEGGTR